MTKKPIWERKPREPSKSYDLFNKYLKLGPDRSLKKLHQNFTEISLTLRQIKNYSSKWGWVERAEAYDIYHINKNRDIREKKIEKFFNKELDRALKRPDYMNKNIMDLENCDKEATSKAHALKSNSSAYKETIETAMMIAGIDINKVSAVVDAKVDGEANVTVKDNSALEEAQAMIMSPKYADLTRAISEDLLENNNE